MIRSKILPCTLSQVYEPLKRMCGFIDCTQTLTLRVFTELIKEYPEGVKSPVTTRPVIRS